MLTVTVESFPDLTEQASVTAQTAAHEDAFGFMRKADATLLSDAWQTLDSALDRRNDVLRIDDPSGATVMRGRFDDISQSGETATVTVVSAERDAADAPPTPSNLELDDAEPYLYVDYLLDESFSETFDGVPTVTLSDDSERTFNGKIGPITLSNASYAKAIREIAAIDGAELHYTNHVTEASGTLQRADQFALQYLDAGSRGTDRTGSVTLSPSNQNVVGDPTISVDDRREVTHLRGFGAKSGPSQVTAEAVASFYAGGRRVYETYTDKDIQTKSVLQEILDRRIAEINADPRLLEIETAVVGVDLELGDRVHMTLPDRGVDRDLRVVELTDRWDSDGHVQDVLLGTRRITRSREQQRQPERSVRSFERGHQGYLTELQATSGLDDTTSSTPQRLLVADYPGEIIREDRVDLVVQGRADSGGSYPTDVEIAVDGTTVTTVAGSSSSNWRTVVDLTGHLATGENEITATPTGSDGALNLTLSTQLYRRGTTQTV